MSQPHGFWEQYKENLRESNRLAPWRLLRLAVAFGLTLLLAPCCWAATAITGEPLAAMVVAVLGIVGVVVVWRTMLWLFDGSIHPRATSPAHGGYAPGGYSPPPALFPNSGGESPFGPLNTGGLPPPKSGFDTPFPSQAGFVPPAYAASLPGQPIMGASAGPVPPFALEPAQSRSGAGCAIAALAVIFGLMLSCCGGGVALVLALPNFNMQVGPRQPLAGPAGNPFGFPGPRFGPLPGAIPGQPFPNHDPFEEMQRAQVNRINELIEENERQMRELDEQLRKQAEIPLGPGF